MIQSATKEAAAERMQCNNKTQPPQNPAEALPCRHLEERDSELHNASHTIKRLQSFICFHFTTKHEIEGLKRKPILFPF